MAGLKRDKQYQMLMRKMIIRKQSKEPTIMWDREGRIGTWSRLGMREAKRLFHNQTQT